MKTPVNLFDLFVLDLHTAVTRFLSFFSLMPLISNNLPILLSMIYSFHHQTTLPVKVPKLSSTYSESMIPISIVILTYFNVFHLMHNLSESNKNQLLNFVKHRKHLLSHFLNKINALYVAPAISPEVLVYSCMTYYRHVIDQTKTFNILRYFDFCLG